MAHRETKEHDANQLQELVAEILDRYEEEGDTAVEEQCKAHPSLADGIRRRMSRLRRMGLIEEAGAQPNLEMPERLGDFRLIERVGGGGMGVVYRAEQISLGRIVAVKLIRPDQLYYSNARTRFAREVSIVASLNYPGIVPVHIVGEASGLPFFAMEFVDGCTLEEALRELAEHDPSSLQGEDLARVVERLCGVERGPGRHAYLFEGNWEVTVIRIIRQVSEALAYAHRNEVLHRDIKPSNVMITPSGKVMLIDFGLSRAEGSSEITNSTTRLGSLPFISPEQLDENEVSFTQRSDVYSLGVALHRMLALQLPFEGDTGQELYLKVLAGSPPRLRKLNPSVSWEAETVCRMAMERDPNRRYASADEFARDLKNVEERQPIVARRANTFLRLKRWSQRNPGRAATAFVGVAFSIVALSVVFTQQQIHLGKMQSALAETEDERARAVVNLNQALEAVNRMLSRVGEKTLENVPQMDSVRLELIEDSIELYAELLETNPDQAEIEQLHVRMIREYGDVLAVVGRNEEAEAAYTTYIEAALVTLEVNPNDAVINEGLGDALNSLGFLQGMRNANEEAFNSFRDALIYLRNAAELNPSSIHHINLATSLHYLAAHTFGNGEVERALEFSKQEIAEIELRLEQSPGDEYALESLSSARAFEGQCLNALGDTEGGLAAHKSAFEFIQQLQANDKESRNLGVLFANHAQRYGLGLIDNGRSPEAIPILELGIVEASKLVSKFPDSPGYRVELANASIILAIALEREGQLEDALIYLESAFVELESILAEYPNRHEYRAVLGSAMHNLSSVLFSLGRQAEALVYSSGGIEHHREVLRLNPNNPNYRVQLAAAKLALAEFKVKSGDYEGAVSEIEEVSVIAPSHSTAAKDIATLYVQCASLAARDMELNDEARKQRSSLYLIAGFDALMKAIDLGYPMERILSDPDLQALRDHPEFASKIAK